MAHIEKEGAPAEQAGPRLPGLRQARMTAGFPTATGAAKKIGVKVSTYIAHENGNRGTAIEVAKRYAGEFGVSLGFLLGEVPAISPVQPEQAANPTTCPVKDLAQTVQLLVEALTDADEAKSGKPASDDHEGIVKVTQAEQRYDALWDLICYKKEQAAVLQALSPGGAAHQVAIASELVERLWECAPEYSVDADANRIAREAHGLLKWSLYSILNVLLSFESTPRDRLAIEYYMAAEHSPFVRTAIRSEAA